MVGMLPGVECARRRRFHFHQGGEISNSLTMPTHNSTGHFSFCLHTMSNFIFLVSSSSSSERSISYEANPEENLGGAAREAKQRLDEKFRIRTQRKTENKRTNRKRKLFSSWFMAPTQIFTKPL